MTFGRPAIFQILPFQNLTGIVTIGFVIGICFWSGDVVKQQMNINAPPKGELPNWGRRIEFEHFFAELVPPGARRFNVRLEDSFASISFAGDEGRSSLAGDRLRHYDRKPYEFIVVPPNFPLRGESEAAPEVLALVFEFEALRDEIATALQISPDLLESRVVIGGPKTFTTTIAERIRRHMLGGEGPDDYLRSLCLVLIIEMLRLPARQRKTGRGTVLKEDVLDAVLNFIDANLDGDLSLEALARLSGVLTHQFARAFKKSVGQSPHHYVLGRRIDAARDLLSSTTHPIAEIAYATGFSSQSHMTTTFKREIGATPAQLRSDAAGQA